MLQIYVFYPNSINYISQMLSNNPENFLACLWVESMQVVCCYAIDRIIYINRYGLKQVEA